MHIKEMAGLNIQIVVLCMFLGGGGKWVLKKGKIILQIFKISINVVNIISVTKKYKNTILKFVFLNRKN